MPETSRETALREIEKRVESEIYDITERQPFADIGSEAVLRIIRKGLADAAAILSATASEAVTAYVSEIREGETNEGALKSTDLYVAGRGISLLVNVEAGESFTYSLGVDGGERRSGTVGTRSVAPASEAPEVDNGGPWKPTHQCVRNTPETEGAPGRREDCPHCASEAQEVEAGGFKDCLSQNALCLSEDYGFGPCLRHLREREERPMPPASEASAGASPAQPPDRALLEAAEQRLRAAATHAMQEAAKEPDTPTDRALLEAIRAAVQNRIKISEDAAVEYARSGDEALTHYHSGCQGMGRCLLVDIDELSALRAGAAGEER